MVRPIETFGKYILLERIQTGGMAEIYLAHRPGINGVSKFFAIKRILPHFCEQDEFVNMFNDEAKITINLKHSNIVPIYEFGIEQGQFFLAMDYVEGRNLKQILNKLKKNDTWLAIEHIVYVAKCVASGLDHAHRCIDTNTGQPLHIIHRDMSPQNIMLSFDGEVKVIDFGIAKATSQAEITDANVLKGKLGYMSPEQAEGRTVDLRTDIFALGIVLWETLARERLFISNDQTDTFNRIKACKIPSLRELDPKIPADLERIVLKALRKNPNERYQTAGELYRELNQFLNRHYPEFSTQDFSVFIRSNFLTEINESRQQMMGYAKIGNENPDKTLLAQLPKPERIQSYVKDLPKTKESLLNVDDTEKSLADLKAQMAAGESKGLSFDRVAQVVAVLFVAVLLIGGLTIFALGTKRGSQVLADLKQRYPSLFPSPSKHKSRESDVQYFQESSTSEASFKISLTSIPNGSKVWINGKLVSDVTPIFVTLPRGPTKFTFSLDGYETFETTVNVESATQVQAKLNKK